MNQEMINCKTFEMGRETEMKSLVDTGVVAEGGGHTKDHCCTHGHLFSNADP